MCVAWMVATSCPFLPGYLGPVIRDTLVPQTLLAHCFLKAFAGTFPSPSGQTYISFSLRSDASSSESLLRHPSRTKQMGPPSYLMSVSSLEWKCLEFKDCVCLNHLKKSFAPICCLVRSGALRFFFERRMLRFFSRCIVQASLQSCSPTLWRNKLRLREHKASKGQTQDLKLSLFAPKP